MIDKIIRSFNLSPKGSQITVVVILLMSVYCLRETFKNFRDGIDFWWWSLIPAGVTLVSAIILWFCSHKDLDSDPPRPTSMLAVNENMLLELKSDAKNASQSLIHFQTYLSMMINRRPLPEAEGMVDKNGNPIKDSKAVAMKIITENNSDVESRRNWFLKHFPTSYVPKENPENILPPESDSDQSTGN